MDLPSANTGRRASSVRAARGRGAAHSARHRRHVYVPSMAPPWPGWATGMLEHVHTTQRAWDTPCDHAIFQATPVSS